MTSSSMPMELSLCQLFQGDGRTTMLLKEPNIYNLILHLLIRILHPARVLITLPSHLFLFKNQKHFNWPKTMQDCWRNWGLDGWRWFLHGSLEVDYWQAEAGLLTRHSRFTLTCVAFQRIAQMLRYSLEDPLFPVAPCNKFVIWQILIATNVWDYDKEKIPQWSK